MIVALSHCTLFAWPAVRVTALQCTVGFAATNAAPRGRGDVCLPHSARSGSQQRMLARGVEATYACPTVHGRVRSNECWPESLWQRTPAPQCTVGFAATNAGPRGRGDQHCAVGFAAMQARGVEATYACPTVHGRIRSNECWPLGSRRRTPAPHCTVGFAATNADPRGRGDVCLSHSDLSGSQQRMLALGVEATITCPTVHGRVRSNEC